MSAPSPEHVEAVARVFASDGEDCGKVTWVNTFVGEHIAHAILTSTDPAVHAAMLAALAYAEDTYPNGLCGNKAEHEPHEVLEGSLAPYWCEADQSKRLPYAAERRQRSSRRPHQRGKSQ